MKQLRILTLLIGVVLVTNLSALATAAGPRDIIAEINEVIGLKPRFEVRAANIENAAAVVYGGKRYILYNERFLSAINNAVRTDWAGVSILAHEIGHHLNGHTLTGKGSNHADELEADEFSGFVLRKMGASLEEAQAAMSVLSQERNSSTHPGRSYRLAAISKGWRSADTQIIASSKGLERDQTMAATEPAAADPPRATQPQPVASANQAGVLQHKDVLRKVNFSAAPREQFYLTKRMNLVHVSESGAKVIGKLARTNSRSYPYYLDSEYLHKVFVTDNGVLVNQRGQKVGYLSQLRT
ncbi:M48 family metalloprotease [Pontibacter beigongshangensis]|uniref:membrane-binding protein n=1 Tax=Pontibacter beigongshangensis TaxID=2574733 RepID=UPI00164F0FD2|nr:membrane-binding protein [Pontibacter beigongshangensis]